jgi:hypothetical protein
MPNTRPAAGEAMPKYTLDDAMIDVGDVAAQISTAYDIIHEMDYGNADGTRNTKLDQLARVLRIAMQKALQTSADVETLHLVEPNRPGARLTLAKSDAAMLEAYRALENDICRAHNMSVILDHVLDSSFERDDADKVYRATLWKDGMEALAFAWKEVRDLTDEVRSKFYNIADAEGQARG